MVITILQIIIMSQFWTGSLIFATGLALSVVVVIMIYFSFRFLSWYKLKRNSFVVLLFGLSFAIEAVALGIGNAGDIYLLSQKPMVILPSSEVIYPDFPEGSFFDQFFNIYIYLDFSAFILALSATGLLLHHYSKKIGKVKFYAMMAAPLILYVSIDFFNLYDTTTDAAN